MLPIITVVSIVCEMIFILPTLLCVCLGENIWRNSQSSGMRLLIILRRLRIKVIFFLSGWKGIRKPFKYDEIKLTLDFRTSSKNGKPWVAQCTSLPHPGGMQGSASPKLFVCVEIEISKRKVPPAFYICY